MPAELPSALAISLLRLSAGFAVALATGGLLGAVLLVAHPLRRPLAPLLVGLLGLPAAAVVPLVAVLFGQGRLAVLAAVVLGAAPAVALGLLAGVDAAPAGYRLLGRQLGARGGRLLAHVLLPAALPVVVGALRQAWTYGWRAVLTAELVLTGGGWARGLGGQLDAARAAGDAGRLAGIITVVLLVGMAADRLGFTPAERWLRRRRGEEGR